MTYLCCRSNECTTRDCSGKRLRSNNNGGRIWTCNKDGIDIVCVWVPAQKIEPEFKKPRTRRVVYED